MNTSVITDSALKMLPNKNESYDITLDDIDIQVIIYF